MGKVIPFPVEQPEQEVIFFELLPEWETEPELYIKYLYEKGLIDLEFAILANRERIE